MLINIGMFEYIYSEKSSISSPIRLTNIELVYIVKVLEIIKTLNLTLEICIDAILMMAIGDFNDDEEDADDDDGDIDDDDIDFDDDDVDTDGDDSDFDDDDNDLMIIEVVILFRLYIDV